MRTLVYGAAAALAAGLALNPDRGAIPLVHAEPHSGHAPSAAPAAATAPADAKAGTTPPKQESGAKSPGAGVSKPADKFVPPSESEIPDNEFGEAVRLGKKIFENTQDHARPYVGNGLNCVNCHLDNGRRAHSAPLWAAYVLYPAYRKKTGEIDTIQSRIQGCFQYSMNGKAPEWNSKEMVALVTYHYWLAKNAPTGVKMPGQGFVKLAKPEQAPDIKRGSEVFKKNCAICHGENGGGTRGADGKFVFPPLWGKDSFNWGAGMHRIDTAASFIKANMPYGRFGSLSEQEAWDVALFMNSHPRPADPRFVKSLEHTRDKFHDETCLYHRSPDQIMAQIEKQEKSEAQNKAKSKSDAGAKKYDGSGLSPAVSH